MTAPTRPRRIEALKLLVREVIVAPEIEQYAARLTRATVPEKSRFLVNKEGLARDEDVNRYVSFGSSPRGGQALMLGAKVWALLDGRANVSYDDIDRIAYPALGHRLTLNYAAEADGSRSGTPHPEGLEIGPRLARPLVPGLIAMVARAFEPAFLQRLDNLVLGIKRARTVRMGRRALGRVQGSGIELESFREYSEGDDLRFLDWNAMARLDSLYTKSYRVERETEVSIMIDASASMGLPAKDDKFGMARALGAALSYIALGENDPVRLISFGGPHGQPAYRSTEFYRRRESFANFRPMLVEIKCAGPTETGGRCGTISQPNGGRPVWRS